jgi:metal transporter CNNM
LYFNDIFRTEGLIALHSSLSEYYGGDLRTNTVTIIGATLDLQEKDYKPSMRVLSIN